MQQKLQYDLLQNNIEALETERKRFASDLHDGVGGKLSALRLNIAHMQKHPDNAEVFNNVATQSKEIIDMVIEMTRRIAHNVMPPDFEFYDLQTAIEDLCDWINESSSIEASITGEIPATAFKRIDQLGIYRVIQELFSNTIKHAGAGNITITIVSQPSSVHITYTDNGIGINPKHKKGLGLNNITDRIALLKGTVDYITQVEKGFECRIQIPVKLA